MSRRLIETAGLTGIYDKVVAGERLTYDDGLALWLNPNLNAVGALANIVRERMSGDRTYYVRNQHINYTNVCNKGCKFCAFYAQKGGPDPYTMSIE
jgi:aminodeoxyfutalosine synthase